MLSVEKPVHQRLVRSYQKLILVKFHGIRVKNYYRTNTVEFPGPKTSE